MYLLRCRHVRKPDGTAGRFRCCQHIRLNTLITGGRPPVAHDRVPKQFWQYNHYGIRPT